MWQRFTVAARRGVFYSQQEAAAQGVMEVTPEHLALALLRDDDTATSQLLASLGVDKAAIEAELRAVPAVVLDNPPRDMQLATRAKKVIDLSHEESLMTGANSIGTPQLLLGILREGGVAAQLLTARGVTLDAAREAARQIGSEPVP